MSIVYMILWNLLLIRSEDCCSKSRYGSLDCEYHNLVIIPKCHNQQHIITLSLAFNDLSHIQNSSLSLYSNLTLLKLNNNKLQTIEPNGFEFLVNLEKLFLDNNQLSYLPSELLQSLKVLDVIYLHHNKFLKIPDITNPSVTKILLHSNRIKSANFPRSYKACKNLKRIDLRHNAIANPTKSDFYYLKNLEIQSVLLNNNGLNKLELKVFYFIRKFIRNLDISNNRKLSDDGFQRVVDSFDHIRHKASWHLDIFASQIGLTTITNSTLSALQRVSLKKLDLSNNFIAVLETDFEMVSDLRDFKLTNNRIGQISDFQFSGLRNLKHLKLNRNQISVIRIDGFHNLRKLTDLDLSDNKISNLDTLVFSGLGSLKKLFLQGNLLLSLATCMTHANIGRLDFNWSINRVIIRNDLQTDSLCFTASRCVEIIKPPPHFPYKLDIYLNFCRVSIPENNSVNGTSSNGTFFNVSYLKVRDKLTNESISMMTPAIGFSVFIVILIILFGLICRKPLKLRITAVVKRLKTRKKKSPVKAFIESRKDYLSIPDLEEADDKLSVV